VIETASPPRFWSVSGQADTPVRPYESLPDSETGTALFLNPPYRDNSDRISGISFSAMVLSVSKPSGLFGTERSIWRTPAA
jgi:hypothetical protein